MRADMRASREATEEVGIYLTMKYRRAGINLSTMAVICASASVADAAAWRGRPVMM